MPCNAKPQCLGERLASAIFAHHTRGAIFDVSRSGAEWWAQVRQGGHKEEGIQFHWDTDEAAVDQYGVDVHPHLSTVTYLTDCGAPTLSLDKRSSPRPNDAKSIYGPVPRGVLAYPRMGKHICFDGQLLHGTVPSSEEKGERVTFLVNVWLNHRPSNCFRLSEQLAHRLGDAPLSDQSFTQLVSPSGHSACLKPTVFETSLGRRSNDHYLRVALPSVAGNQGATIPLEWPEGSAELRRTL